MQLEPDGIHVMMAEDHTTSFVTTVNSDYTLDFNGKSLIAIWLILFRSLI